MWLGIWDERTLQPSYYLNRNMYRKRFTDTYNQAVLKKLCSKMKALESSLPQVQVRGMKLFNSRSDR